MRFFIKLAVLVLAMHGWLQVEGGSVCETSPLRGRFFEVDLTGDTYLEPDFYVAVAYHDEFSMKNSPVIIYFDDGEIRDGEGDCHVLKREILAQDNISRDEAISFFKLLDSKTDKEVGFGSCLYAQKLKQSCEFQFKETTYFGDVEMHKVYVDIAKRRFTSYTFAPGKNWVMTVETKLE